MNSMAFYERSNRKNKAHYAQGLEIMKKIILHLCADIGSDSRFYDLSDEYEVIRIGEESLETFPKLNIFYGG